MSNSNSILLAFGTMLGMIAATGLGLWIGSKVKSVKLEMALLILVFCAAGGAVLAIPVLKSHLVLVVSLCLVYGLAAGMDIYKKLH